MKKITILAYFIVAAAASYAQSDSTRLAGIIGKLDKQTATHPVEKVYLHFNKPSYLTGDTIWFKAYLTVGALHQPSALSGVLYAELIDDQDKIIKSLKLKIENATAAGDIAVSNTQAPGEYRIRAYTNWMRNAGPDYFFNKTISIGDFKTNAVLVSSYFDVSGSNHEGPVNAKLVYTDKLGRAYDHKPVSYELKAGAKTVFKGIGITDDKGMLTFAFSDKAAGQKRAEVVSHIQLLPGITVDKTIPINLQSETADVQFFPEGGQLINGVRSKVAFKAIGINGLSVELKGVVLDNEHNEVAEFKTQHAGMGVFAITPVAGKTYSAKITLPDSSVTTVNLPQAIDKGFVLAVNNSDSAKISVRIATNEQTLQQQQGNSFYLIGQSGGKVYYTTLGKLDNESFTAVIPKSKFPTGIVQFTLFSADMKPLNERVMFVQNPNQLNLTLATDKSTYHAKEKVNLAFAAIDAAKKPAAGSFSVSVFNEDALTNNENTESTILSNILLTSDLKGYIEEPNYYFAQPNQQTSADLDVLMLTQGYRRFSWNEVINETYPPVTFQPEKRLSIAGTLTTSSGKPVANGKVKVISMLDKIALDTITNAKGEFIFPGIEFPDSTQLVIQAHKADDSKDVDISVKSWSPARVDYSNISAAAQSQYRLVNLPVTGKADSSQFAEILKATTMEIEKKKAFNFQKNNELKEVKIKTRKNAGTEHPPWQLEVTRSANLNGPGNADQVIAGSDLNVCVRIVECLISKIPGLSVIYEKRTGQIVGFHFLRHMAQSIQHTPPVVVILDGEFFPDLGVLEYIVSDNILTIEVLKSSSYLNIYGQNASGGALVITTKIGTEGANTTLKKAPGVINTKFSGFTSVKQFYTPKYNYADAGNIRDTRDAVYWNPNIITDEKGAVPIEFYNSDVKGTYRAVVEGIDNDGNIGRYVYRYKVE